MEDVARYRDGGRGDGAGRRPGGVPRAGGPRPSTGCWRATRGRTDRSSRPSPATRWGLPVGIVEDALERLLAAGTILRGEFRPGGAEREWCDPGCPASPPAPLAGAAPPRGRAGRPGGARPVPAGLAGRRAGRRPGCRPAPFRGSAALERLAEVVDQLAGVAIPASVLERDVLPARVPATSRGSSTSSAPGRGRLGRAGEPRPRRRPDRRCSGPVATPATGRPRRPMTSDGPPTSAHERIREHLAARGASLLPRDPRGSRWRLRPGRCSTRCGTSSGPARSPTTPSRRCGPCAGSARPARPPAAAPARPPHRAGSARRRPVAGRSSSRSRACRATERLHAQAAGPARAARRPDPRGGRWPRRRGRLLRGVPGPAGAGGGGPDPARLLRRRPGGGAVRAGRRARSAAGVRDGPRARRPAVHLLLAAPIRPTRTVRPSPGRAAATRTGGRSSVRPGRTSCSSTGSRRSTWSAAARRSRRSPGVDDPTVARRPCAGWRRSSPIGRFRELVIRKVDGVPIGESPAWRRCSRPASRPAIAG